MSNDQSGQAESHSRDIGLLTLAALGVVFGDIGTSPLYAFRECFLGENALAPTPENVLGVLSLIVWSLLLVIGIKYATVMLSADNQGEGGILALVSLLASREKVMAGGRRAFVILGLVGTVFLYADAMITPAISVLSAIEGLGAITPILDPFVVPLALAILILLYLFQYRGTSNIGMLFGPIILAWFVVMGVIGGFSIADNPQVLSAIHPKYAIAFFADNGFAGFLVLGVVFLVVTGGETLYADMGHFGRVPMRLAFFTVVLPALLLNYAGQAAHALRTPAEMDNIFFRLAPEWGLIPLVLLATLATMIASQAVISGAFSLTSQAIQLGYCPRLNIIHTSPRIVGQIYIPLVNWVFMLATVSLVLMFGESGNLAAAYGLAVASAMFITALFLYEVARRVWGWRPEAALLLAAPFVAIHLAYLCATLFKIPHGGWFPLLVGVCIYLLMSTWEQGYRHLRARLMEQTCGVDIFLNDVNASRPHRVPGVAVFLTRDTQGVPRTLLHNFKHNQVLHETIIFLTIETERVPKVKPENRASVEPYGAGVYRVILRFGFREHPIVPVALKGVLAKHLDMELDPMSTSYFLGRETLIISRSRGMPMSAWRRRLFAVLLNNAADAARYFRIPVNRVVEIGAQIEI